MKTKLFEIIFIGALLSMLLVPTIAIGEDIKINSSIKIDRHWIYIIQQEDLTTLEVNEYFYINNTGEAAFNDSFYIWLQNDSIIAAECCNGIPNMACRYRSMGHMECFYFNKTGINNLYVGHPILSENRLSYYGQREPFSITVYSTTNSSLDGDTLHFNATIDGKSLHREQGNFQGIGVHLTSENLEIGMAPIIEPYMPYNITTTENLTLFNNGTDTEIIGFKVSDLPQGWNTEIWNNSVRLDYISLAPQEHENLTLKITAPSNIASIYVKYTTQVNTDGNETKGLFEKRYLYETKKVSYEVYLLTIDNLEVSSDLKMAHEELYWIEEYERYWFYAKNENIQPNSSTTIGMNLLRIEDNQSNPYIILALVFIVISIIIILLLKKTDFFKEKESSKQQDIFPKKSIKELEMQKTRVLSAIKRIEKEFEEGVISKEDYERFRASYKKRAVEILKEIDQLDE